MTCLEDYHSRGPAKVAVVLASLLSFVEIPDSVSNVDMLHVTFFFVER